MYSKRHLEYSISLRLLVHRGESKRTAPSPTSQIHHYRILNTWKRTLAQSLWTREARSGFYGTKSDAQSWHAPAFSMSYISCLSPWLTYTHVVSLLHSHSMLLLASIGFVSSTTRCLLWRGVKAKRARLACRVSLKAIQIPNYCGPLWIHTEALRNISTPREREVLAKRRGYWPIAFTPRPDLNCHTTSRYPKHRNAGLVRNWEHSIKICKLFLWWLWPRWHVQQWYHS